MTKPVEIVPGTLEAFVIPGDVVLFWKEHPKPRGIAGFFGDPWLIFWGEVDENHMIERHTSHPNDLPEITRNRILVGTQPQGLQVWRLHVAQ